MCRRAADTTTEEYRKSKLLAVHKMFDVDKSGVVDASDLLALGKVRNETLDSIPFPHSGHMQPHIKESEALKSLLDVDFQTRRELGHKTSVWDEVLPPWQHLIPH